MSREFHGEISVSVVLVNLSRRVAEQRYVKTVDDVMSDILHASCRDPGVEFRAVTLPADEHYWNATSQPLVQYFIYLVSRPTSHTYWC